MHLALTIDEACKTAGIGRTKLYEFIKNGELDARKVGARTLILRSDLEQFLNHLPTLTPIKGGK